MNLEKVKVVVIRSGNIVVGETLGDGKRWWYLHNLTQKGVPDKRKSGHSYIPGWSPYQWGGRWLANYALFDAEREAKAKIIRDKIDRLEKELDQAQDDLYVVYAGPKIEPTK